MSTQNVELTMNTAPNNYGIIAANNYGNQHNHYHNYDAEQANRDASIRIRDGFFLSDPVIDRQVLQAAKGTRVLGTFDWIYENAVYNAWLSGSSSLLWITGSPGKGKTMMAMYLATQLESGVVSRTAADGHKHSLRPKPIPGEDPPSPGESVNENKMRPVYAFFCRSDDEKRNSAVAILRGMIYQVLSSEPTLSDVIKKDMEGENRSTSTLASKEALWSVLEKLIKNLRAPFSYCVLDGLDECDQDSIAFLRRKILCLYGTGNNLDTAARPQWLIISRDVGDIHDCARLSLDHLQTEVDQDIKRVVTFTFDNMVPATIDEDSKTRLIDGVLDGAGGTFLWAGYIAHELAQRKTKSEIIRSLQILPKDLNVLYDRMLREISQRDREMCAALLRWVALAFEPLTLVDLAEALEIKGTSETTALEELDLWIQKCGHIIQVTDTKVSLVHQSAKDYLLGSHAKDSDLAIFRVTTMDGHYLLASRCIDYLEKSQLSTYTVTVFFKKREFDPASRSALESDRKQCAFFAYALEHWVQHVQLSSTKFSTLGMRHPGFFSLASGICTRSLGCRRNVTFLPDDKHAMNIAIDRGILQWAMAIHNMRNLKDLRFPLYRMKWKKDAMNTAIYEGYLDIVTWLLDIGCDVNTKTDASSGFGIKRLPLVLYAFERERYDIVDLLVQRGALVYGKPVRPESVHALSCRGYDPADIWFCIFIKRFVGHAQSESAWASVSCLTHRKHHWTFHCIWHNKFSLIRQLQPVGIRFDAYYTYDDYCVLEQALSEGLMDNSVHDVWEYLVQQVVDQDRMHFGSDGTSGHGHCTRACQASEMAVENGNAAALRTLFGHKCFIEAAQLEPYTWLKAFKHHSSHPEIIPMLIDYGAVREHILHTAVEENEYAVVEVLLSKGLDPNVESTFQSRSKPAADWSGGGMTPLRYAERIQDDRMITLLQRFGAKR